MLVDPRTLLWVLINKVHTNPEDNAMKLADILNEAIRPETPTNYGEIVKLIKQIAPYITAGGMNVDGEIIAKTLGLPNAEHAQQIINWGLGKARLRKDNLVAKPNASAVGDPRFERLVVDLFSGAHNRKVTGGADKAEARTGIPAETIVALVDEYKEMFDGAARELGIGFRPAMYKMPEAKTPEQIAKLPPAERTAAWKKHLRNVIMQATENGNSKYYGTLTADNLTKAAGIPTRQIDKLLSSDDMMDLNNFRVIGRSSRATDKDKELRYHRELAKQNRFD